MVSWSPGNPAAGNTVTFSVTLKNQGTVASAGGAHAVTLTILNGTQTVKTLTGSYTGALAAGASSPSINLGTWTAVNGKYTVRTVVATDANELPVKQANNTSDKPFFVGRGANMPYDMYEAEDGTTGGGASVVGPNRTVGDLAGEASGRKAVTLNATGAYVQWTTKASTNTLVARFSIPDGTTSSIDVFVDGTLNKTLPLTSKYAWLYGNETQPQNSGTGPRHIYDEANIMLAGTVPAGSTIKLQKSSGNPGAIAIDFINLEQVAAVPNPDPAKYVVPAGFDQQAVQNAFQAAQQDTSKTGVYLPAGDYQTTSKFQVGGRALQVVGAGPWFTRFFTPQSGQTETDAGFSVQSTANGSTFKNFAFFGNYTIRQDGPGKVFDLANVSNITLDNIWAEHTVCFYWGANTDNMVIKNIRIRDTFADGVNMTNGSTGNLVDNSDARATGDDSFRAVLGDRRGRFGRDQQRLLQPVHHADLAGRGHRGLRRLRQHVQEHLHRRHPGLLGHHDQLAGLRVSDERFRRRPADGVRQHLDRPRGRPFLGRADVPGNLGVLRLEGLPGHPGEQRRHRRSDLLGHHVPDQLRG